MWPYQLMPWVLVKTASFALAAGGASGSILGTTNLQRWILGWNIGNRTNVAYTPVKLRTLVGLIDLGQVVPWLPSSYMPVGRRLPGSDTDVEILCVAGGAQTWDVSIIYADAPRNAFSPLTWTLTET